MILDTNVLLYHVQGRLATPLAIGQYMVSFVTEIEVLSYPQISQAEETQLRQMFSADIAVVGLTDDIKERAIAVRRNHRLRLPDALIVATAIELSAELVTNDLALTKVAGLRCRSVKTV